MNKLLSQVYKPRDQYELTVTDSVRPCLIFKIHNNSRRNQTHLNPANGFITRKPSIFRDAELRDLRHTYVSSAEREAVFPG